MITEPVTLYPAELRRVFGSFLSGVIGIAAMNDGAPAGLATSSFTSVSLHTPLVSICVANTSTTWPILRDAPRFGVSILAANREAAGRQLAASGSDRFANLGGCSADDGAVTLDGANAWFHCSAHADFPGGDRDLEADHDIRLWFSMQAGFVSSKLELSRQQILREAIHVH